MNIFKVILETDRYRIITKDYYNIIVEKRISVCSEHDFKSWAFLTYARSMYHALNVIGIQKHVDY